MNPAELFEMTRAALQIAGLPCWECEDSPHCGERLFYNGEIVDEPTWLVEWTVITDGAHKRDPYGEDLVIGVKIAEELIKAYLKNHLLERGWQVQVRVGRDRRQWRLVDCLAAAEGGGDRLDVDYPYGDDELAVLCESVLTIATAAAR